MERKELANSNNGKQKQPPSKKKTYPECHPMNAQCSNILGDHDIDFPTTDSVKQWRNCLLCLLTELVVIKHDREDKGTG